MYEYILIPWFMAVLLVCISLIALCLITTPNKGVRPAWAGRKRILADDRLNNFLPCPGCNLNNLARIADNGHRYLIMPNAIMAADYHFSDDILNWLDWHLEKYPKAILPKQEAVFVFETGTIKSTTTLCDGQDERGIDLLKEAKKMLSGKVSHGIIPVHRLAKIADNLGGGNGNYKPKRKSKLAVAV